MHGVDNVESTDCLSSSKDCAMSSSTSSRKRGPYKRYLTDPDYPVPRQTRYNWRLANAVESDDCESDDDLATQNPLESPTPVRANSSCDETEDDVDPIESATEDDTDPTESANEDDANQIESATEDVADAIESEQGYGNDRTSPTHLTSMLYPGAGMSQEMGMMLIMSLASKHKLTYSALADILKVICLHLPADSIPASYKSVYRLLKKVTALGEHSSHHLAHKLCGKCGAYLSGEQKCCKPTCQALDLEAKDHIFLELPVDMQVRALFQKDKEFQSQLLGRFRRRQEEGYISDVYDGKAYLAHMVEGGFLSNPMNISMLLNTDGIQVFKSSNLSLWPIYLVINELPPHLRFTKKYTILAGLWCSNQSPPMFQYLRPILERCKLLQTEGIEVPVGPSQRLERCRAMILCVTTDLPAKAKLLNFTQFNGEYGCTVCKQKGRVVPVGAGRTRVYEYPKDSKPPLRSHEDCLALGKRALQTEKPCFGVKGISPLHILPSFNIVDGAVIDYMHCLLEGIGKKLFQLWLSPSANGYYIGRSAELISHRLTTIKPPDTITRTPRPLSTRKKWKASEYRAWFLFYCLAVLNGILPPVYLKHLALLVCSMHILLGDRISLESLSVAEYMLNKFYHQLEELYGFRNCTMNVHLVSHLTHYVRLYGPLWTHSCFAFESLNGYLVQLKHGTQHVVTQVQAQWSIMKTLTLGLEDACGENFTPAKELLLELNGHALHTNWEPLREGCYMIGGKTRAQLNDKMMQAVNTYLSTQRVPAIPQDHNVDIFSRFHTQGMTLHSVRYQKVSKRNSYTVRLSCGLHKYGCIQCYITVSTGNRTHHLAVISPLNIMPFTHLPWLPDENNAIHAAVSQVAIPVQQSAELIAIPLDVIDKKCVYVEVESCKYICVLPNMYERD